ncbi:MAG: hypothetical protein HY332_23310 [Chloroflexi bacterium]|nr:hypothetical protein [Chloroflexota bacterium]
MPTGPSALNNLFNPTGGIGGFTPSKVELLDDETRAQLGLPPASQVYAAKRKESLDGTPNGLGKEDFLKLLLAQLSNQDPLRPMEDREFIAQLAQFNTLEQMQQANRNLVALIASQTLAQASALLGKQIEARGVKGEVTAVTVENGSPKLSVGSVQVALSDVIKVLPGLADTGTIDTADTGGTIAG